MITTCNTLSLASPRRKTQKPINYSQVVCTCAPCEPPTEEAYSERAQACYGTARTPISKL